MYCRNCGKEVNENDKFCSSCGNPTRDDGFESAKRAAKEQYNNLTDTQDYTASYDEADIEENRILSLFAYLGILILVPIFAAPESKYTKFHVSQGVNLIIAELVVSVLTAITSFFVWVPLLPEIMGAVASIAGVILSVLLIIGIINAVTGKAKELPIVGKWKIVNY